MRLEIDDKGSLEQAAEALRGLPGAIDKIAQKATRASMKGVKREATAKVAERYTIQRGRIGTTMRVVYKGKRQSSRRAGASMIWHTSSTRQEACQSIGHQKGNTFSARLSKEKAGPSPTLSSHACAAATWASLSERMATSLYRSRRRQAHQRRRW